MNCICCNHISDNTEPSQETFITRVGGTTAPSGSDNDAGSTSFGGDNDGGFDFDTDEVHALVPEMSKDADLFSTGALNNIDAVTPEEEIKHVLSNPADFTRNSYRYFWNQSQGRVYKLLSNTRSVIIEAKKLEVGLA